jgi:hypothetical protein
VIRERTATLVSQEAEQAEQRGGPVERRQPRRLERPKVIESPQP